jgi:hypothetical protein
MTAVRPLPPEKEAEINRLVAGREARLVLEGNAFDSKDVRLTGNTVQYAGREAGGPQWLPTQAALSSLQRIQFRDHGRGAVHGFGIGAGIGAVGGGILGALVHICVDHSNCPNLTGLGVLAGAAVFGLIGAGVGAATGAQTIIDLEDAPSH